MFTEWGGHVHNKSQPKKGSVVTGYEIEYREAKEHIELQRNYCLEQCSNKYKECWQQKRLSKELLTKECNNLEKVVLDKGTMKKKAHDTLLYF